MLTLERKQKLLEILKTEGRIQASDLSQRLGISEDTIRRDLRELAKAGLLQKVYGGALPRSPMPSPYLEREKEGDEAKQAIGAAAALLLKSGEFVVVDAGTTPLAVVRHLPLDLKLTVATHSIPALEALAENPGVECEVIGGRFLKIGRCAVGADTVDGYRKLRSDTCILGASGVHPAAGVTTFPGEVAEVKRAMVANAARVILVILGERLGTVAPYLTASLSQITHLVTDRGASSESVRALREVGVELTVV